jgi:hypothetical protein
MTICSTQGALGEVFLKFSNTLETRGYITHEVKNVESTIKWENKGEILQRREHKNKKGEGESQGIPVVITDKTVLRKWWEASTRKK